MSSLASVTDGDFRAAIAQGVTLVDFWAPWCRPCIQLTPLLEKAAEELGGRARIVKMDVDANPVVPVELGVMSIPALVLFKNGQRVTQTGNQGSAAKIVALVETALG